MATDGRDLLVGVRQVRQFLREIAGLLATADGIMEERGWGRRAANTAISDSSASLQAPDRWMPFMAFRFYQRRQAPHLLPSVSVVLDGEEENAELIVEPLVVATVFDFGPTVSVSSSYYNYNHAGLYARLKDRSDDGRVTTINPQADFPSERFDAHRMSAFGIPLVEVNSSSALKERIIVPLLALIDASLASSSPSNG